MFELSFDGPTFDFAANGFFNAAADLKAPGDSTPQSNSVADGFRGYEKRLELFYGLIEKYQSLLEKDSAILFDIYDSFNAHEDAMANIFISTSSQGTK